MRAKKSKVIEVKSGSITVKIYPVKNGDYRLFMVTWFEAGRRCRKNFADEAEARKHAKDVATRIAAGEADVLRLTSADRESYLEAKRRLATLEHPGPLHDAIRDYVHAMKELNGAPLMPAVRYFLKHNNHKLPHKRVPEIVEEFIKAKEDDGASERYLQDLRSRLRRFAKDFSTDIGNLTTRDMDGWLRKLGQSPRSRKNYRTLIVTLFHYAKDMGYLPKGQETEADGLSVVKYGGGDIEIYTPRELAALLAHADEHTLPFICFGAFAGLRSAEILRLTWDCVRWDQGVIEIRAKAAKTGQRRLVPIQEALRSFLRDHVVKQTGLVIHGVKIALRLTWAAQKADLAEKKEGRAGVDWKRNALRHSYASYRLAEIQNAAQLALEMGNSPTIIFQHYRELVTAPEARKWFGLSLKESV
jgi:integrase